MDWSRQTVLVTGAGGFIGSHLTERLLVLGARTRALIHYNSANLWGWLDSSSNKKEMEIFSGDVQDRDSLRTALKGVDIIFHLASLIAIPYSYQAPLSYVRTNIEGTLNILQMARDAGVHRVVHTSTSEVYGTARQVPINEEHPLQGQSPYAASKIAADKIAEAFYLSFQLPVTTVRPFNTYGPRQSARAVIPTIITQSLTQKKIHLGSLTPTRDFNYVVDTVEGFIAVAQCDEAVGQVVNIGSGKEISIGDLARTIQGLMGTDIKIECEEQRIRPKQSEVLRLCADNGKAKKLVGWTPKYTLETGLAQTIEWMEQHFERYRPEIYNV